MLIEHVRKLSAEATALKLRLEATDPTADASPFADLTIRHGLEWASATIRWAESAEKELEARLASSLH